MTCPKCQSTEVDSSGTCLVCGFNANESIPLGSSNQDEQQSGSFSGMIEMDYASPSEAVASEKPELPQWRQELSRRLREIKQKRDAGISGGTTESAAKAIPFPGAASIPKAEATREAAAKTSSASRPPRRSPRAAKPTQTPEDRGNQNRPTARPAPAQELTELPLFQSAQPEITPPSEPIDVALKKIPAVSEPDPKDIQRLIDSIVARQPTGEIEAAVLPTPRVSVSPVSLQVEDRLILVSRTLSGLVDLLVVAICTGAFIIAADMASGIDIFDRKSLIVYSLLLLATYLVYSTFFLGTVNQTIGMMLTDLRVVDSEEKRPLLRQILWRCFGYLVSLLVFGVGLLWGCFDRQGRCLHDRLSDTRVVRL